MSQAYRGESPPLQPLPNERWPWVTDAVRRIEAEGIQREHVAIVERLSADSRMAAVWRELQRQPFPATPADRNAAMGRTLHAAYRAVVDDRVATKLDVVLKDRCRLQQEAETLRRVSDNVVASVERAPRYIADQQDLSGYLADAEALRRIAVWLEQVAAGLRDADDPLTITNFRGDPLARGVQITIAVFLKGEFGHHLHGTAATLTAVALGLDKVPSATVSRSAFSKPKAA